MKNIHPLPCVYVTQIQWSGRNNLSILQKSFVIDRNLVEEDYLLISIIYFSMSDKVIIKICSDMIEIVWQSHRNYLWLIGIKWKKFIWQFPSCLFTFLIRWESKETVIWQKLLVNLYWYNLVEEVYLLTIPWTQC